MAASASNTAAVGTVVGTAVATGGTSAIVTAAAAVIDFITGAGFRTSTTHLDWTSGMAASQKLFDAVWQQVTQNLTNSQTMQLARDLQNSVANFMVNSDWWNVGNDVAGKVQIVKDILNDNVDPGHGALIRMGVWIFRDSPKDNPKEALTRCNDALSLTLYPLLNGLGASALAQNIQVGIAQQSGQAISTGTPTAPTGGTFFDNLFGSGSSATQPAQSTMPTQASFGKYAVYAVLAVVLIGLFTSTGRKALKAI